METAGCTLNARIDRTIRTDPYGRCHIESMLWILLSFLLVPLSWTLIFAYNARTTKYKVCKGFKQYTPTKVEKRSGECTRDNFKERKLPSEIDYVVVSPLGG